MKKLKENRIYDQENNGEDIRSRYQCDAAYFPSYDRHNCSGQRV